MFTWWIAVVVLAVPPLDGSGGLSQFSRSENGTVPFEIASATPSPATLADKPLPPRSGVELREAARTALARWARPSDQQADVAARELLTLYEELRGDDKLAPAQREQLRGKVRIRLLGLARQIEKRIAIQDRLTKADRQRPKSLALAATHAEVLAQWAGRGGPGPAGAFAAPGFAGMAGLGAPGGANADYGQDLVDLIQRTIAPATWDVNGGPGAIYYWFPGRALVIRQTDEVHEAIGGALEQLERASR